MKIEERLELLKQIEKDIHVCSLESTFLDDAKSCAIHSVIEELEQNPCGDAISKQSVLNACEQSINILEAVDRITDLPSVEQEPCEDEYIKVPKKALKYRTAGMVAYNVAWLREHWQMEMDIVCGVKPCDDCISRQAVHIELEKWITYGEYKYSNATKYLYDRIDRLPPVNPQEKTGHWIPTYGNVKCSVCGSVKESRRVGKATHYCDFCGARMISEKIHCTCTEEEIAKSFIEDVEVVKDLLPQEGANELAKVSQEFSQGLVKK